MKMYESVAPLSKDLKRILDNKVDRARLVEHLMPKSFGEERTSVTFRIGGRTVRVSSDSVRKVGK